MIECSDGCPVRRRSLGGRWVASLTLMVLLAEFASFRSAASTATTPQNLLLIIADDVGTDGLHLFNNDPRASFPPTPNIDALHQSGVLFRNAYSYPTCSPTRATMLTGRYGFRTGIGYALADPSEPVLQAAEFTLPEVLSGQPSPRYRHANIGKWHLSFGEDDPRILGGWDHFSGVLIGALPSYEIWPKTVNGSTTSAYRAYATSDNVNDALTWLGKQGDQPWLLWMAFNAAHTPFHKPDNSLHSYDRLPDNALAVQANPRPYYEAMIESLDTEIGRLLQGVDRSRTTIVFLGDNGTLHTVIQAPYSVDRGKGTLYQGGIRIPLIIAGPAVVRPHRESTAVVHTVDLFATLLELAGANPALAIPPGHPIDSRSLVPILSDQPFQPGEDAVLAENFSATLPADVSGRAAMDARYKLIRFGDGRSEFYDLEADALETTNLLASAAGLAPTVQAAYDRLAAKLDAWANPPPTATLTRPRLASGIFEVQVSSTVPGTHQLQRAANPAGGAWQNVGTPATGTAVTLSDPGPNPAAPGFYRVRSVQGTP